MQSLKYLKPSIANTSNLSNISRGSLSQIDMTSFQKIIHRLYCNRHFQISKNLNNIPNRCASSLHSLPLWTRDSCVAVTHHSCGYVCSSTSLLLRSIFTHKDPPLTAGSVSPYFTDARSVHPAANFTHPLIHQLRWKSRGRGGSSQDEDSDSDEDDTLVADDFDAPSKFKVMKIHTASMRTDAIISNSLDVARNRLEESFYGSGLMLNGAKMLKKSVKMEEGDYVDLVVEKAEDQLKVKRVKVLKIYEGRTKSDKMTVKVRVWKIPFLIAKVDDRRRK